MKKNVLRLTIILLLVALCVMQFSACGDEVSTPNQPGNVPTGGDNDTETSVSALAFALNQDGQSYTVTGLKDKTKTALRTVTALVLQSTYQGLPVTSIGWGAFYVCVGLTSITIPNSVMSIGEQAFSGCMSLTSIRYNGTKEQWEAIEKPFGRSSDTASLSCIAPTGTLPKPTLDHSAALPHPKRPRTENRCGVFFVIPDRIL